MALSYVPLVLFGIVFGYADGDTITVHSPAGPPVRVRLATIDAAERHTPEGKRAQAFIKATAGGRLAICRTHRKDALGRHWGSCEIAGADLAGFMLRTGHAVERKGRR